MNDATPMDCRVSAVLLAPKPSPPDPARPAPGPIQARPATIARCHNLVRMAEWHRGYKLLDRGDAR